MLGSHNSFSYIEPIKLCHAIITPWHKCQNISIYEQYDKGIRYFDLRIRFKGTDTYVVHNYILYCYYSEIKTILNWLNAKSNPTDPVFVRIGLDIRHKPKDANNKVLKFLCFIQSFNIEYPNIVIDKAITFWDWKHIVNSNREVKELHYSVCKRTLKETILGIHYYAKKHNSDSIIDNKDIVDSKDSVLMLDYINLSKYE